MVNVVDNQRWCGTSKCMLWKELHWFFLNGEYVYDLNSGIIPSIPPETMDEYNDYRLSGELTIGDIVELPKIYPCCQWTFISLRILVRIFRILILELKIGLWDQRDFFFVARWIK